MRPSGVQGTASTLLRGEQPVGINLALELGQKRSLSPERRLLGVMFGVHGVGGSTGTEDPLTRRHLLLTDRRPGSAGSLRCSYIGEGVLSGA